MKPELLIWDWNGTILDDALVCRNIANIMLSERGIPTLPDMDAYRAVFGFPIKSYYEKMGYRFGPQDEPYEHVADEFIIWYDKLYRTALLRPGIVPFLDRLKGEGYRQVLLSATRLDQLLVQVAAFGDVGDRFEKKLGLTDHYAFSKAALARDFIESQEFVRMCSTLRGSVMVAGPLLARVGRVWFPKPGGDKIDKEHDHGDRYHGQYVS